MIFNTGYYSSMDREEKSNALKDMGLGVKDIGMSVPMGIAAVNVEGIQAKIRSGAGNLEIQFPGMVRGQRNAQTPEMYGKDQRVALEEISRANQVTFTTHASFGVGGLAGQDQHGNFNDEYRKTAVDEIKKAIEFAADAAGGGSVVVHTGEYIRPISEEPWAQEGSLFREFKEEPEKAVKRIVDERTGQVITQIRKNQIVARAVFNRYESGNDIFSEKQGEEYADENGNTVRPGDYVDYWGNYVKREERVPKYDKEKNTFVVTRQGWEDFEKEATEINKIEAEKRGISVEEIPDDVRVTPEEAFLRATTETQEAVARGWALNYGQRVDKEFETLKKLNAARKFYEQLESNIPEEEKWRIKQIIHDRYTDAASLIPPDIMNPTQVLDRAITDIKRQIESSREMVTGQLQSAEEQRIMREHAKSAPKYALERSYNSYAEAGMYAFEQTKKKHLDRPVYITPENIFPEQYGGHPQELKNIVLKSRERMTEMLEQRGYSEGEAKKMAETHIKATLDTGHLNTWRKYFQGSDEKFKDWMLQQTEELAKSHVIGNIHLSDNYGYQDDHLAPGQGNTPVKEMVMIFKKHGYDGPMTVEPGADATTDQSDFHGLMKTWRYFDSPVYGSSFRRGLPPRSWDDIQDSYFGKVYTPNFIFGAYAPSNDWSLWSQVPLE
jgi:sugar phosphate isomerase/epimerase